MLWCLRGADEMLLADWRGIKVRIWSFDHNRPHVHVKQAEHKAGVVIRTGECIDGFLPPKVYRRIRNWLERCQEEILSRWNVASIGEPFTKIGEDCEDEGDESSEK